MSALQSITSIEQRLAALRELATISESPILDKNSQRAIKLQLSSDLLTISDQFYQLAEALNPPLLAKAKDVRPSPIKEASDEDELATEGRPSVVRRQPRATTQPKS